MKILLGADPEVFMFKGRKPISAHGFIEGTKKNPLKVKDGAVQVDGMALEFNIDPAEDDDQFVKNITNVMKILGDMVPDYKLKAVPVANFGHDYIHAQPPEALELGCDPDFDAWNGGEANPRPNGDNPFRTGAGHVHIGWTENQDKNHPDHIKACITLVKELDMYLALPSLLYDKDNKRRTMYGAEGAFRPKSYGVEYRTLSNAWLNDEELMRWVSHNTRAAVNNLMAGKSVYDKDYYGIDVTHELHRFMKMKRITRNHLWKIEDICDELNITLPPLQLKAA